MYTRPDRPLIVKCTFDRWNKRITFSSARNCTYELLRDKVEQCFSLYATSYAIAYKDDDGEVTDITTDSDLTEAIQYFQAGGDDPPLSSAASILSGRSFGSRKITLRVQITVDYDGPSLSDTSSLVSMDDYKGRNGSQLSFAFSGSPAADLDDDSVTVSSRDNGRVYVEEDEETKSPQLSAGSTSRIDQSSFRSAHRSTLPDDAQFYSDNIPERSSSLGRDTQRPENPFDDEYHLSAASRFPENASAVFERLKLEEAENDNVSFMMEDPLVGNDRGAAWLRDQNERIIRSMLGALPDSSVSDEVSLAQMEGDLALQRGPSGKYYYSYTSVGSSGASQTHDSGYEDGAPANYDAEASVNGLGEETNPRPTSMQLDWLASHQIPSSTSQQNFHLNNSNSLDSLKEDGNIIEEIPPELLQFLPLSGPPPDEITDCSECGIVLDSIRYVCSTCGGKSPIKRLGQFKGKAKDNGSDDDSGTYPPTMHRTHSSPRQDGFYFGRGKNSNGLDSSTRLNAPSSRSTLTSNSGHRHKPLPSLPQLSRPIATLRGSNSHESGSEPSDTGYELCSDCLQSAGVNHAIQAALGSNSSANGHNGHSLSPSSPEDAQRALSQWRRLAPQQKGKLRHAYLEKVWGPTGWENVDHNECRTGQCSTCDSSVLGLSYKCASCKQMNVCRACYGQLHEIHPLHAFLVVSDDVAHPRLGAAADSKISQDHSDEQSMTHPGVKCAHCLLNIVGARFHCAICESIDICSNCESAGLPGNLDSSDGGHNSSHIMIKIPYPLERTEVQTASRRAIYLWTGRDAANVQRATPRSRSGSVVSSYAMTVVGSGALHNHPLTSTLGDHGMLCDGCSKPIFGVRYQCASCPSLPTSYNLCGSCEEKSYFLHDAMHIFFKLPRPVQRPLQSPYPLIPKLYKQPVGCTTSYNSNHPKDYLKSLLHLSAICDRCVLPIQGPWFRCAYCPRDLCDACEDVDTHDSTHLFLVFKSKVDVKVFQIFANLDNPNSRPLIPFPVYNASRAHWAT